MVQGGGGWGNSIGEIRSGLTQDWIDSPSISCLECRSIEITRGAEMGESTREQDRAPSPSGLGAGASGARSRAYDMTRRAEAVKGTRRRIAEAALELFKERDYDAVSLNDIALAAGVSHQTVLNHCESKAGVVLAAGEVFGEQVRDLEARRGPRRRRLGGARRVRPLRGSGRRQRPLGCHEHARPGGRRGPRPGPVDVPGVAAGGARRPDARRRRARRARDGCCSACTPRSTCSPGSSCAVTSG